MKILFALLALAACQAAQLSPGGLNNDARSIVELTLIREARIHTDPEYFGPGCVRMQTEGTTFDETRDILTQIARNAERSTDQRQKRLRERTMSRYQYQWQQPSAAPGARPEETAVDANLAQSLDEAAHLIVHGRPQSRLVDQIEIRWVRTPLRPCGSAQSLPSLSVSSPAFHGNVAFVETGFACGGLCGFGQLYALVRRETGWEIVAVSRTWVS